MANRRFEVFDLRQVLIHMRSGQSDRQIQQAGLMGRRKAARFRQQARDSGWLDRGSDMPSDAEISRLITPSIHRDSNQSKAQPFADIIKQNLERGLDVTTIHDLLQRQHGFDGSYDSVRRLARSLTVKPIKPTVILDFSPGEAAQVDFGQGPMLFDPGSGTTRRSWVFIMTLSWSRHQYAEFVFDQKVETWLACHRRAFEFFGGVPRTIIIDNLKSGITKACFHDPEVQRSYAAFAEAYGFIIRPCPPYDPQKKGIVESGVKYIKRRFIPARDFKDVIDANRQLREWILSSAGNRIHGSTREQPLRRFHEVERAILLSLPAVRPEIAIWTKAKLHPDCHVQYQKCRYSSPWRLIGQDLWIRDTGMLIEIYHNHVLVASHIKSFKPGRVASQPEHLPPDAKAYFMKTPQWCLQQAKDVGPFCLEIIEQMLSDKVIDRLRSVQAIIGLRKKYGDIRLEKACERASSHGATGYKSVKRILEQGLDSQSNAAETATIDSVYGGGGRYCREISTLLN
jgi:transposase